MHNKLCLIKPQRHWGTVIHNVSVFPCVIVSLWFKSWIKN